MLKWLLLSTVLLTSSCNPTAGEDAIDGPGRQPRLLEAAQSVSLVIPLHFDPSDRPPGYIKVAGAGAQHAGRLIEAVVICSPGLAWFEGTSHTSAIVIPSEENVIWDGADASRPSDEAHINCIKNRAQQPFFYRKEIDGVETYRE